MKRADQLEKVVNGIVSRLLKNPEIDSIQQAAYNCNIGERPAQIQILITRDKDDFLHELGSIEEHLLKE